MFQKLQIVWDILTRQAIILTGSDVIELPGRYESEDEALAVAQAHCREIGLVVDDDGAA
jgi:hypothetical protein